MTEGTLSGMEAALLRSEAVQHLTDERDALRRAMQAVKADLRAAEAEIKALKHDIGRHMDAVLAAEEALHKEREECAALCELRAEILSVPSNRWVARLCADDIRSRTQETSNGTDN